MPSTQAATWFEARLEGRRLPIHEQCDLCGEITGDATFNPISQRWECVGCIENQLEQAQ